MKKVSYCFGLVFILVALGGGVPASAQGRGEKRGHDKQDERDRDRDGDRRRDDHRKNDWDRNDNDWKTREHHGGDRYSYNDRRGWERRNVRHYHVHDRQCNHSVTVVRYERPRYIYYRDYDVYYDCTRNVYISYSGRSWSMTAGLPFAMRHVNIRTARSFEVDYWDDDFPRYLERRRPSYGREYKRW